MPSNSYHFVTHWRVKATCREVSDILERARELPRWWPSVYLQVRIIAEGGSHALGQRVDLLTKGRLPYRLRWQYTVVEERYPYGSVIEARGDFVGRGEWILRQDGDVADITYVWDVRAEKPLLRLLTPLLRPAFSANHRWAMAQGLTSLERELQRRRSEGKSSAPA